MANFSDASPTIMQISVLKIPAIPNNNHSGPNFAQIAVHVVPWELPTHIGKIN